MLRKRLTFRKQDPGPPRFRPMPFYHVDVTTSVAIRAYVCLSLERYIACMHSHTLIDCDMSICGL